MCEKGCLSIALHLNYADIACMFAQRNRQHNIIPVTATEQTVTRAGFYSWSYAGV